MSDHKTTQGPFVARPLQSTDMQQWLTIAQASTNIPIAIVSPLKDGQPNYGDAALLAAAPHMFDTLILIQEKLMSAKNVINLEEIADAISQVFEKIAAEADAYDRS